MDELIEVKNLYFSYDKQNVLENINLNISKDDFLAIIGPNGGGKSTLLKLILNMLKPTKGEIILNIDHNKIGYVPQNTNINIHFPIKVIDVVLMAKNNKFFNLFYSKEEIKMAKDALKKVGMEEYLNSKINSLSGGQRQRVMIARALCSNDLKILILDEPTSNIDIQGQKQIFELLKELNKTISIVIVSHDISLILGYATKVAHINRKIVVHKNIQQHNSNLIIDDEHFCEIEMLQLLSKERENV